MEKTRKVTDKKEEVLQEDTIQAQEVEAVAAAREFSDLDEKPVKESKVLMILLEFLYYSVLKEACDPSLYVIWMLIFLQIF